MGTQVLEVGSRLKDCWRSQEPIRVLKTLALRIQDEGDEGNEGDEGDRPVVRVVRDPRTWDTSEEGCRRES